MTLSRPNHGGNLAWAARLAGCSPSEILDFSASINPLGPPKSAIASIHQGLDSLKAYPDPEYFALRLALAQWHQLSPEWILPGNGSAELLTWAARDLAQLRAVCLLAPAFSDYERALKAFGAKVHKYPLRLAEDAPMFLGANVRGFKGSSRLSFEPLPPDSPHSTGLILNTPHNPSGKLFLRQEILPYLERFSLVVVDEAFMDFLPPHQQQSLIAVVTDYPNLVILRSLTKFYSLPGLRLGYAIAHPERLQRWQQWRDPWSVNALAAAVGEVVIKDSAFQHQTWEWLIPARGQLYQELAALDGLHPLASAANFLLVRTQQAGSQVQAHLLKHYRILIRDCLSFPELGDRYFRVAVRTPNENQRLVAGLASVLHALA